MKLSFSTKGWHGRSFDEFCDLALKLGFQGIEIHNIDNSSFSGAHAAIFEDSAALTVRNLYNRKLELPCIDVIGNLSDDSSFDAVREEILRCLRIAGNLHIRFVRLRATEGVNAILTCKKLISSVIEDAEKNEVCMLIETTGLFRSSAVLREFLDSFASDYLGALWLWSDALLAERQTPNDIIRDLGAYVRHVHLSDARKTENGYEPCLVGEGDLPIPDLIKALSSIGYSGYISIVWNPDWIPEFDNPEIILAQFASFMMPYISTDRPLRYYNKSHTGTFIWKKEALIEETYPQVLDRMASEYPDQYCFKYTTLDYTRTYSQFRDDVDEFARSLIALGVGPGSHVAVWASNVPQWYIAFWAVTRIGAVLVSVNTAYKIHEVEYLLRQSDTHTLILTKGAKDTDYSEIIAELCPELESLEAGKRLHAKRLPFLRNVISVGFSKPGFLTWENALNFAPSVPVSEVHRLAAKVKKDDVCNMQYTSGTTGFPKGVMLTHYNVVNNGKCIGDRMDLSTADRMMIQVPMFHCFGMVLAMTACFTHAVSMFPLPYFSPKPALSCIHNEHITAFHGVPTMFIALLEHPDFEKTDFSHIRTGIMAGSPCPISVMQKVVDKMHMSEITIVYGQTEASPGCTMSSTDDSIEVRVGTVGRPLPEIECKIIDPATGEDCPVNVTGEFVARGYNIMKGYYKMPDATSQAIDADGWLHTGDLACKTPEGNFRITGRLKDMIIRGGENIYPKEIEEFIYTHPKVRDVQVIGVPDEQYGEEIMACVILKDGETMTEAEMKAYINDHMARHKVPKYVDFVDSFPMNVAGKILKYKMRENAIEKYGLQAANKVVTA